MKTLQSSEPQLAVALLLEGVCLVAGFRVLLGSAIEEVTSPPGDPLLGLTVDSNAHSPQDPDPSSLIPHPRSPRPHSVAPHSPPHSSWAGCVCSSWLTDLGPDSPPIFNLFSVLNESLSLKGCQCPQMHTRADGHMDFQGCPQTLVGQDLENMGVRVSGRQCLQPL